VAIPGATASTLVINQSGLYSVTVTNSNGCSRNSTNFNPSFVSIAENGFLPVQIFPNPTTGNFTLSYDDGAEVEIRSITDAYGKQVKYEVQETHGGIIIDLASVSQGVYFVNYTLQDGFFTHRVSVQW
jgi:hypothetical protein